MVGAGGAPCSSRHMFMLAALKSGIKRPPEHKMAGTSQAPMFFAGVHTAGAECLLSVAYGLSSRRVRAVCACEAHASLYASAYIFFQRVRAALRIC